MTARITAALALAALVMLAALVTKVMAWDVLAGTLLASALVGTAVLYAAYRLIATGPGQRCAPRGFTADDERIALPCEREVIPRVATEHAPPWDPQPEPVLEPAAVLPAPVPEPAADVYWIATGTVSDGRLHSVRAAVVGAPLPGALLPPVAALLGHATVDDALDSIFTRAMSRQVRELTDGRP